MASVYEVVTNRILELLESGIVPWAQSWRVGSLLPRSLVTERTYNGINVMLTGCQGYESPYWLTYRQAQVVGGKVRRGERGTPIIFWCPRKVTQKDGAEKDVPFLRYYTVFNVAQIEGLKIAEDKLYLVSNSAVVAPIETAERIVRGYEDRPEVHEGMGRACYRPGSDVIDMPSRAAFFSPEEFYSTLFHELVHSTGHEKRLNRETLRKVAHFADHNYSQEELVAEMGSAMLCGSAGISARVIENQAAYIGGWIRTMKSDSRAIVLAAARAQRASDWVMGKRRAEAVEKVSSELHAGSE